MIPLRTRDGGNGENEDNREHGIMDEAESHEAMETLTAIPETNGLIDGFKFFSYSTTPRFWSSSDQGDILLSQ